MPLCLKRWECIAPARQLNIPAHIIVRTKVNALCDSTLLQVTRADMLRLCEARGAHARWLNDTVVGWDGLPKSAVF